MADRVQACSSGCGTLVNFDCDGCPIAGDGCADCPVGYLLGRDPEDAVVYDHSIERALRLLDAGGLLGRVVSTTNTGVAV